MGSYLGVSVGSQVQSLESYTELVKPAQQILQDPGEDTELQSGRVPCPPSE